MAPSLTVLAVPIALVLLSYESCASIMETRAIASTASLHVKRQTSPFPDGGTCIMTAINSGSVSLLCVSAISTARSNTSAIIAAYCSSVCTTLCSAAVTCYGAAFAQQICSTAANTTITPTTNAGGSTASSLYPDGGTCIDTSGTITPGCNSTIFIDRVPGLCSSACDSYYSATLKCYGVTKTQQIYSSMCLNGYAGPTKGAAANGIAGNTIIAVVSTVFTILTALHVN